MPVGLKSDVESFGANSTPGPEAQTEAPAGAKSHPENFPITIRTSVSYQPYPATVQ